MNVLELTGDSNNNSSMPAKRDIERRRGSAGLEVAVYVGIDA
jgi:hypothetical protein